jgi:hypothetical protein
MSVVATAFGCEVCGATIAMVDGRLVCHCLTSSWVCRDSDGTATAAANGDLPVPQDCQARAESIAQTETQHDT